MSLADRVTQIALERFIATAAGVAALHPRVRRERGLLDVLRDMPYVDDGDAAHLLDIYRPTSVPGPWPVVVYVHGGSFRMLSKDTHWAAAMQFAKAGYLTFVVNYRLSPQYRFPAALEDLASALRWIRRAAPEHGGDVSRLVLAGESAGANLTLAYAIAVTFERPEAYAREIFAGGIVPQAIVPACGILQVTNPERFDKLEGRLKGLVLGRISGVGRAYLGGELGGELADPLVVLESEARAVRAFPVVVAGVGDRDLIADDTRRLRVALEKRGITHEVVVYSGGHAFEMLVWRESARRYWRDTLAFLGAHVGRGWEHV